MCAHNQLHSPSTVNTSSCSRATSKDCPGALHPVSMTVSSSSKYSPELHLHHGPPTIKAKQKLKSQPLDCPSPQTVQAISTLENTSSFSSRKSFQPPCEENQTLQTYQSRKLSINITTDQCLSINSSLFYSRLKNKIFWHGEVSPPYSSSC